MGADGQPRATEWLMAYRPLRISPRDWAAVRPFVTECAECLGLDGGAGAVQVVRVLARLAVWAAGEGMALDAELVLDPDTVERFVAVGLAKDPSRAFERSRLRRLGPLLTTKAPWESRPATVAYRHVAAPYTARELDGLRTAALAQSTPRRVRAARALVALGAGAGLDGRWVSLVVAHDVTTHNGAVLVRVGEPTARTVPVLAAFEREVLDLAATAGDEFLVGGRSTARGRAGSLAASLVVANGTPKFSSSRLRSTWLVTHLTMGTRMPELARAAGMQGITVLSDLLAFVPPLDEDSALEALRGAQ